MKTAVRDFPKCIVVSSVGFILSRLGALIVCQARERDVTPGFSEMHLPQTEPVSK